MHNMNASLMQVRNYVTRSAHLKFPGDIVANPAAWTEIKSYCVSMRETLVRKNIYNIFTTTTTVDNTINAHASKEPP